MGSLQLLVPVSGTQVLPTMPSFIFVLVLASQAFSLPCPSPDFPCAISAAACASGELANKTICASCQECAREEGGACEWSEETRGAGQCARCIVIIVALIISSMAVIPMKLLHHQWPRVSWRGVYS